MFTWLTSLFGFVSFIFSRVALSLISVILFPLLIKNIERERESLLKNLVIVAAFSVFSFSLIFGNCARNDFFHFNEPVLLTEECLKAPSWNFYFFLIVNRYEYTNSYRFLGLFSL